jgi:glycosyltransferase involved in cell wall biosynthesis
MTAVGARAAPTRVLRVFSRLNVGGPSLHVVLLSAGLRERGYETRLVVGQESAREGDLLELAAARGVDWTRLAGLGREVRAWADARALAGLVRLMREFRPAIVHTHAAKAGVLGRLAAHLTGRPVLVHTFHGHVLHGYFGPLRSAAYRLVERALGSRTDAVLAVSEGVKRELLALGVAPARRVRVVELGLELEPLTRPLPRGVLRREAGIPAGAPLVGAVGRLVPIKDLATLLEAARLVREALPACRFVLVGDGEDRGRLEAEARRLGLADVVHFAGWRADLAAVYGDLDLVANSSRNEGTPVALIEALAAGRPVVATRVGGTPDLLGEGERGLLVPAGEPGRLARAILDSLRDPEGSLARARAGRSHVLARHDVARLLEDIDRLYRDLLARRAGARPA